MGTLQKSKKMTAAQIIRTLETHKGELKRHGVKKLGLFGSVATGKQTPKSDLDFLVVFQRPTFDNYMELKFLLEKLFKRKADLVVEDSLKPQLRHIKRQALYAKVF